MAREKISKAWKSKYVKTVVLAVILIGSIVAFWIGVRTALGTEYPLLAVASGSMVPTLNVGDLIVVQGVIDASQIYAAPKPNGTIIVFHKPSDPGELIVHRAIAKVENGSTWYFRTRGDNNPTTDSWLGNDTYQGMVSTKLLVGRVVAIVPWIGNVPLFIRTPPGTVLIISLLIIVLLVEYVPVILRKFATKS